MGKSYKRNDGLMIDSSAIAIDNEGTSLNTELNTINTAIENKYDKTETYTQSEIKSLLNSEFVIQAFTKTVTKPAAGAAGTLTYTVTKSGHTPLGVVGFRVYQNLSTYCNISCCYLANSTTAYVQYRNLSSSQASEDWPIIIYVLYRVNR